MDEQPFYRVHQYREERSTGQLLKVVRLCLSRTIFLYLVVALVVVGEGEIGSGHLVLRRPPAPTSAMAKIAI